MTIGLLEAEPELRNALPLENRSRAERSLQVPVLNIEEGEGPPAAKRRTAYLMLGGILMRRVTVDGGSSVELLDRGSVLIPSREDAVSFARSEWRALERVRIAELDLAPDSPLAEWPPVFAAIAMRAIDRSRSFAVQSAIMSIVGVEERLHALLWALAERWGTVTPGGVELRLQVHQATLAEMVGARRPTVNLALGNLCDRGALVNREPGRWVLRGEPPRTDDTDD